MAVPLCLRCRWFPAAVPGPWSHWSHPASRSCKCLRPPTRARRAPPTDPPFVASRSSASRLRAGPSLHLPRARTRGECSPRLAGPARWPLRPSVGRLLGGSGRRVTKAVHLRPKCVAALRAAFPPAGSQAEVVGVVLAAAACLVRALVVRVPAAARPAASRVAHPYAARRGNEWRPERLERFPAVERARQLVAGVPEPIRPRQLRDREGGGVLLTARPLATCRYGVRPDGRRIILTVRRRGGSSRACAPGPPAGRAAAGRDLPAGGRTDPRPSTNCPCPAVWTPRVRARRGACALRPREPERPGTHQRHADPLPRRLRVARRHHAGPVVALAGQERATSGDPSVLSPPTRCRPPQGHRLQGG